MGKGKQARAKTFLIVAGLLFWGLALYLFSRFDVHRKWSLGALLVTLGAFTAALVVDRRRKSARP